MAASETQVDAAYDQVEAVLLDVHNLTPLDDADFSLINQADMLDMATTVTDIMTFVSGAVAGISLVVVDRHYEHYARFGDGAHP
jgi:putative ABC transport system permease protein